jgi:hypothetical protein
MIWNTVVFRWEKERRTEDESTRQLLFSNVPKETIKRKIRTRKQKPEEEEKKMIWSNSTVLSAKFTFCAKKICSSWTSSECANGVINKKAKGAKTKQEREKERPGPKSCRLDNKSHFVQFWLSDGISKQSQHMALLTEKRKINDSEIIYPCCPALRSTSYLYRSNEKKDAPSWHTFMAMDMYTVYIRKSILYAHYIRLPISLLRQSYRT